MRWQTVLVLLIALLSSWGGAVPATGGARAPAAADDRQPGAPGLAAASILPGGGGGAIVGSPSLTLSPGTTVDDPVAGAAATLRRLRVQKVTPATVHPAWDFSIHHSPGLPPVSTRLEANVTVGPAHELMVPVAALSVYEGPQQGGWRRGGYALLPDPSGTAQCSPNLSFGPDYTHIDVPEGDGTYLVCVRNTYDVPDVALTGVVVLSSSLTQVTYSFEVTNLGSITLDPYPWKVESWASTDAAFDPVIDVAAGDSFLTGATPLTAGAKYTGQSSAKLQDATFASRRYLIVRIVTGLPEVSQANNALSLVVPLGTVHRLFVPQVTAAGCDSCPPGVAP